MRYLRQDLDRAPAPLEDLADIKPPPKQKRKESREQLLERVMATTGIDRAGAEQALVQGKAVADAMIKAYCAQAPASKSKHVVPKKTKPHPKAKAPPSRPLTQKVIYILERIGSRGGPFWLLVLECGHLVSRTRRVPNYHNIVALRTPMGAPKQVKCYHCDSGASSSDPWPTIRALEGADRK